MGDKNSNVQEKADRMERDLIKSQQSDWNNARDQQREAEQRARERERERERQK